jgi:hypothetical protein
MHVTDQLRPQLRRDGRPGEMPGRVIFQRELISVVNYRCSAGLTTDRCRTARGVLGLVCPEGWLRLSAPRSVVRARGRFDLLLLMPAGEAKPLRALPTLAARLSMDRHGGGLDPEDGAYGRTPAARHTRLGACFVEHGSEGVSRLIVGDHAAKDARDLPARCRLELHMASRMPVRCWRTDVSRFCAVDVSCTGLSPARMADLAGAARGSPAPLQTAKDASPGFALMPPGEPGAAPNDETARISHHGRGR